MSNLEEKDITIEEQGLLENEKISGFEEPEEYLLYYARIGKIDKLKKLFEVVENEKTLINVNVKGESKSNRGWTALHLASYFGHYDVVQFLINKKADVNVLNNDGDTPLHKAAFVGRIDIVTLLLANNADVLIKNEDFKQAKDLTRNEGVSKILEEVEESDFKRKEAAFLTYSKNGDLIKMKELLNSNNPVNVNCQDEMGNTALHNAAFRGNKQVISFLLQQNNIDTTLKNKRLQIPASLAPNISLKQLLLEVKPSSTKSKVKSLVNRFEGSLSRRNKIRVWRTVYCVLEKGVLSFFNNRADACNGTRRRDHIYLESALIEAHNENLSMFTIFFNTKSKVQLQVLNTNNTVINREKWINAIQKHIDYSKNFIKQGFKIDEDSDEDLNDLLPTNYLQNLINNSQAHQNILNRQINGLSQFIDEDLKIIQAELPETISVEISNTLMALLKKFWPALTFHLNFIRESAQKTSSTLQQCLNLMDKQDKLRQLQLKNSQNKIKTLEEIVQALAQQQYDFEKSIVVNTPYKSPPRTSFAGNDNEDSVTDCEEYFDAFDEEEEKIENISLNASKEKSAKLKELEEFQVLHDLQKTTSERNKLPAKMIARANINLWSILKNCAGKELSKITMPVVFNEPLSFLQRITENCVYLDLIKKADESTDPLTRIEYVAAYAVACLSNNWLRMNKPFNPLLGETYEYEDKEQGFVSLCEQVSHHPPISAYHVESEIFERYGSVYPKLRFWGKSIEIKPDGKITLFLKNHNEAYTWSNLNCCIHNVIVGTLWFEQYGKMEINCSQSDYKAVLEFKSAGWTGKDLNRLDGFITNKKTNKKLKFLYGKWTDYFKVADMKDYETFKNKNDQNFRVPEKNEINQIVNDNSKKVLSKLNNLSLRSFSSTNNQEKSSKKNELNNNLSSNNTKQNDNLETETYNLNMPKSDSSNSLDIPNSKLLWLVDSRPENSSEYYNFTDFTFKLNELDESQKQLLPITDSRFRPDIRLLELGDLDAAADEKNRLEEKQREVRKKLKKNKEVYCPLWFKLEKNPYTNEEGWRFNKKYFNRDFSKCSDIF